jgi:hypothetical protein
MKLCTMVLHNLHCPTVEEVIPVPEADVQFSNIYKEEPVVEGITPEVLTRKNSLSRVSSPRVSSLQRINSMTAPIAPIIMIPE